MDSRLLRDLYDIADYYNKQIKLLEFQSYNGLSNTHKKIHTNAAIEISLLRDIMRIFYTHNELVTFKSKGKDIEGIDILIPHAIDLLNDEIELVTKYHVSLVIERANSNHDVTIRFSPNYRMLDDSEELPDDIEPFGLEVIYSTRDIRANISPYYSEKENEQNNNIYAVIAPSITNTLDSMTMRGKGKQDSHLYIPDLHTRILDLATQLDYLLRKVK